MTSKRETQTAFLLMQDVCGAISTTDENSIKDVWKKGVDIGIERANKQVEEIAKETAKANEVCRKASNDIESLQSGGPNRLTEFETELQIAELKCGNLKSQLDYMRYLYQGDKKEEPTPVQQISEPAKKERHKRHREKHTPPEEPAPPVEPVVVKSFLDEPISRLMTFQEPSLESPSSVTFLPKESTSECRLDVDLFSPLGGSQTSVRERKPKKGGSVKAGSVKAGSVKGGSVKGKRKKQEKEKEVSRDPSPEVGGFKVFLSPRAKEEGEEVQPPAESRAPAGRGKDGRASTTRHRQPSKGYSKLRKEELKSEEVIHDILNGMTRSVFEINELNQTITKDHEKEVRRLKREKLSHRRPTAVSTTGTDSASPRRSHDETLNRKKEKPRRTKPSREGSLRAVESRTSTQRLEDSFNEIKEKAAINSKKHRDGSSTTIDTSPTRFLEETTNTVTTSTCNPFSTASSRITVNQIYDSGFQRVYADENLKRKSVKGKASCVRRANPCNLTNAYPALSEISVPCSMKRRSRARREEPKRPNKTLGPFTQSIRSAKKEGPPPTAKREAPLPTAKREAPTTAKKEASELPRKKKLVKTRVRTSKTTLSSRQQVASSAKQSPPSRHESHANRVAPPLLELYHNAAATVDGCPSDVHVSVSRQVPVVGEKTTAAEKGEEQQQAYHEMEEEEEEEMEVEEEEVKRNVKIPERRREQAPVTKVWDTRSTRPAPPSEMRETVSTEPCFRRSNRNQPYPLRNAPVVPLVAVTSTTPSRYTAPSANPIREHRPSAPRYTAPSVEPIREHRPSYPPITSSLGNHRYELPTLSSTLKKTRKSYFSHFNFRRIPFTVGTSTTPTHNIGLNMQQCLSIIKMRHVAAGKSPLDIGGELLKESHHSDIMKPISAFISRMSSKVPLFNTPSYPAPRGIEYPDRHDCGGDTNAIVRKSSTTSFQSKIYVDTNILGQPSQGEFIRVQRNDVWSNGSLDYQNPDPKYGCFPERNTSHYKKLLEAYHANKDERLAARKGAVDAGREVSKEQEEFFATLQGRVRGLKQVLTNLQDEFKELNVKYNEMTEAFDPNSDSDKSTEIREMEAQLQAKENEIQVVLGLFKEVITLKNQVSALKGHISTSSFATTMAPSNYGYHRSLRLTSDQSTAAVRLTKVLRTIQNFQHELKQERVVWGKTAPLMRSVKNC